MQAMLSLQQENADAHLATGLWERLHESAQSRCNIAEARRIEVEGQLRAKRNEVDSFRLLSTQQAEVGSLSYVLSF